MPQILNIDRAADVQVVHGRRWSLIHEELVCVPEACDVRATVAAILNEELTLKSPDVVDAAVWTNVTGRTPVRTNSASERPYSKFWSVGTILNQENIQSPIMKCRRN